MSDSVLFFFWEWQLASLRLVFFGGALFFRLVVVPGVSKKNKGFWRFLDSAKLHLKEAWMFPHPIADS